MILKYIKSFFYSLLPLLETCLEELVKIIKNYKSYNQYLQFKVWLKQNGAYITMKQQIKFLSIDNRYFVASEYIKVFILFILTEWGNFVPSTPKDYA